MKYDTTVRGNDPFICQWQSGVLTLTAERKLNENTNFYSNTDVNEWNTMIRAEKKMNKCMLEGK